jgi:predicted lysophospholipase L1 biosynthesis ABC-type transport system permease subunit
VILFSIVFLASTGLLTMRELTANIEASISRETRPIFGADLRIYHTGIAPDTLIDTFSPYLSGTEYSWAEIRDFSTTLISSDGKTGLVRVIAYTGDYPQRWVLETEIFCHSEARGICSEEWRNKQILPSSGWQKQGTGFLPTQEWQSFGWWRNNQRISASDELITKYSSWGIVMIDGRKIEITDRITKSSDMGFSFASENSLIVLPLESLSGSLLISSGSRLSQDLLVSFARESDAEWISAMISKDEKYSEYRTRTFAERSERTLDIVDQVTDYILLILLISFLFASIVMRSAHDRLFASLRETLRITEILGLTRARQAGLFALVYAVILPLAWIASVGLSCLIITGVARLPGAEEFVFLMAPVSFSLAILALLVIASFYPAWQDRLGLSVEKYIPKWLQKYIDSRELLISLVFLVSWYIAVYLIFSSLQISLFILVGLMVLIGLGSWIIALIYRLLFRLIWRYRERYFVLYDALRTHVRPLAPSVPVTLSLVFITSFFIVFLLFSLSFREKLSVSVDQTANIYAINILEQDRVKIEKYLSWSGDMYSILRARISKINNKTLAEHLDTPKPTGEFTREFNITTSPLDNEILRGKKMLEKDEVSVDSDFAKRLKIDLWDRIEFLLSGKSISLTIANIRDSKREGFVPFFYFSFDPDAFRTAPKTYFVSAYASDTEKWKQGILANSWPHVTFVDIDNLLVIVRDISTKVLSVISLFLVFISVFALFAIVSLLGEMRSIERLKSRLYPLFGMTTTRLMTSLWLTRASIFVLSYILSLILGLIGYRYIMSTSSFIDLSLPWLAITIVSVTVAYGVLVGVLRAKE